MPTLQRRMRLNDREFLTFKVEVLRAAVAANQMTATWRLSKTYPIILEKGSVRQFLGCLVASVTQSRRTRFLEKIRAGGGPEAIGTSWQELATIYEVLEGRRISEYSIKRDSGSNFMAY